ncbi:hypothetical protein HPB49_006403 [Dermacentor silvarum]|uniref:Uncharacterized protein n=1 Tax=Dermacentor silvarum TaxID=543639 RepID=A0ACB8DWI4_DERSI|nr:hypothetical protein HPB49_006403 [Dermacentor silvarum]
MARNCGVPLCSTNASKDPQIRYHEFPINAERRAAWLRNISREGPGGKGTVWQPNDRSLVCALHFTEQDYKKTEKLRILLPTAVPTVFPDYPSYMSTRSTPAPRKKRPRLEIEDDNAHEKQALTDFIRSVVCDELRQLQAVRPVGPQLPVTALADVIQSEIRQAVT